MHYHPCNPSLIKTTTALIPIVMCFSKSFQKLVLQHIKNNIPASQFSHRTNRSTEDAASTVLHSALTHLEDNNTYIRMLFVDFSSAFNTISPMICKLCTLGFSFTLDIRLLYKQTPGSLDWRRHTPAHIDNLFEWHFSVRGPPDSDFDGGVYHGRIVLPPEYPMKPPSIILLTPNGRFEVGKKICLSISGHHPETWQPSWSIRTALIAIIGFMPTKGEGAIGSLDYTPEERRALAKKSQDFCCEACGGGSMRSALLALTPNSDPSAEDDQAKELAQQINFKEESSLSRQTSESGGAESEPSTSPQGDSSSSAEQQESEGPRAELVGVTLPSPQHMTCLQPATYFRTIV
ncbi:ubiquitin-conjugating enzyme E2 J1 [Notothenia coriiceps]|uniref:Ubiquitin-conjugating enzyme E2 J1 n=1 Tax=Notothenia coriiceps TaxID=8208 RepID=A0A6I9NTN6_9TELE|nr:PREDICTED: ubiquitin-conjugating enzyme E2 J1 [Notothenia coriiceps]